MRNLNLLSLVLIVLFPVTVFSQSLSLKESVGLEKEIYRFFVEQGPNSERWASNFPEDLPSEALLCLLSIDSNGKVGSIHLLSDDKNRDSAFSIFSRMAPLDFQRWSCEKCKGKTIMLLITVLGSHRDGLKYAKDLASPDALKPGEVNNVIIMRGLNLYWPTSMN